MSKSNPVRLWRFGRTGALIFTQKWPNRAKTGVPKNTKKNLWGPPWGVLVIQKIQLTQNNWKIKFIFYGLATRELYFLKKKDTKWPFPPSSGNWPIYGYIFCMLNMSAVFWSYLWANVIKCQMLWNVKCHEMSCFLKSQLYLLHHQNTSRWTS